MYVCILVWIDGWMDKWIGGWMDMGVDGIWTGWIKIRMDGTGIWGYGNGWTYVFFYYFRQHKDRINQPTLKLIVVRKSIQKLQLALKVTTQTLIVFYVNLCHIC